MSNAKEFLMEDNVLLQYKGRGGDVVVPDGVETIEGQWTMPAFEKSKNVASITLPASMKALDPNQFYYLKTLKWIECKGEIEIENENCVFPGYKALVYVVCNPNTPLSQMPQKWKQWLAIGVTKYLADGNPVDEKALDEVRQYIKSQNKKLALYKIGYEYPFVAKFMIDEGILSEEQYDEMIAYAQENKHAELTTMLLEGRSKQYPSEEMIERAEKKIDQEIAHAQKMEDHSSTEYLKTQWTWKKREDGTLIIWTYKGNDTEVFIPAVVGKNKVTAIRGHLFESNNNKRNEWLRCELRSIHIEEGITEIGGDPMQDGPIAAFAIPTNIYLPRSITKICRGAFISEFGCIKNVTIHAPAGSYAEQYAKENNIPFIQESDDSESILIPDGQELVPEEAFSGNLKLTSIIIPKSVKTIGRNAFAGCKNLTEVELPKKLKALGDGAFRDCSNLTSIVLPESIRSISSNLLCGCSKLRSIVIPNGINEIESSAFKDCISLTEVILPKNVETIEPAAFCGCSSLQSVSIQEKVNYIGFWVFKDCPNVTIHAPAGSYAEKYAKENNIPFEAE